MPFNLGGGQFLYGDNTPIASGVLTLTLSAPATVISTGNPAPSSYTLSLDDNGAIVGSGSVYGNAELSPAGTYYIATVTVGLTTVWGPANWNVGPSAPYSGNLFPNVTILPPWVSTGGTSAYNLIKVNGTTQTIRGALNVKSGTGLSVTGADNSGGNSTDVTFSITGTVGAFVFTGLTSGIPATCTVGQLAFITDAAAGRNIFECTATNTWTQSAIGGSGSPGGVNGQLQANIAGSFAAINVFTDGNSLFTKGPIPVADITAYEGVPGTVCFNQETMTGSISGASHTLSVSGGTWTNGCFISIANAGPATSLSAPTIASVAFSPATMKVAANGFSRTGNVVTVKLSNDASVAPGDTIVVANATGCAHSPNGTFTVATTNWVAGANNINGNIFTYNQTAGNDTACGGDNGDGLGPATIVVSPGSTHYAYKVGAMDFNNGLKMQTSATTITNGVPTLEGMTPNVVTINCVTGAASYPVWRQTGGSGNFVYIGSALPCVAGYTRTTTTLPDYGQAFGSGFLQIPIGIPVNAPSGDLNQIFISQITSGGGTTTLTLADAAVTTVSGATTTHDNTVAFNAALTAARTAFGGGRVLIPNTVMPRFCNIDLTTIPANVGEANIPVVTIQVEGGLWPNCTIHKVRGEYKLIGTGGWAGSGNFNQSEANALIVTGDLNPTIYDESNQSVIQGFTFSGSPDGHTALAASTAIYGVGFSDIIYKDLATGGWSDAYSPGLVVDSCSGFGGSFGLSFTNMNFIGSNNFPVPSAAFHCIGSSNFNNIFLGQRPLLIDYTTLVSAGGSIYFNNWQGYNGSEAVHSPSLIVFNPDNSTNLGLELHNFNPADPLYGFGGIVECASTGPCGNVSIYGSQFSNAIIIGKPFDSAFFANIGESAVGAQTKSVYSVLGQGPAVFSNGTGIATCALNVVKGGITIGGIFASLTNFPGIYMVDQALGGTGMSATTLGNTGNNMLWLDSANPTSSAVFLTGADTQGTLIQFLTPNSLSNAFIGVVHDTSGGALILSQNTFRAVLYGESSGNFSPGDLSIQGRLGFASNTTPMFLTGSPTAVRTHTFPDRSITVAGVSGTLTNGHLTKFDSAGNIVDSGITPPAAVLNGTTSTITPGALTAGQCGSGNVTVTGATTGMAVAASPVTYPGDGAYWLAYVSAADTVTVKVCAVASLTPTPSAYNVRVIQ